MLETKLAEMVKLKSDHDFVLDALTATTSLIA